MKLFVSIISCCCCCINSWFYYIGWNFMWIYIEVQYQAWDVLRETSKHCNWCTLCKIQGVIVEVVEIKSFNAIFCSFPTTICWGQISWIFYPTCFVMGPCIMIYLRIKLFGLLMLFLSWCYVITMCGFSYGIHIDQGIRQYKKNNEVPYIVDMMYSNQAQMWKNDVDLR